MILIEAWKNVVLNNYSNFEGRANRAEFWWFVLANLIASFALLALSRVSIIFVLFYVVYVLAVILPGIAVVIRRLHDTNKSGWLILIALVPLVGGIILIVFYATQGDEQANNYGPPSHWSPTGTA